MPPKGVDKAKQKEKERVAVDKTFGMKNKNKSKVVQKYIKSITNNAKGESSKTENQKFEEKAEKAANHQKAALMASLFNLQTDRKGRAYDPVAKKAAKQAEEEAIAAGKKLKDEVKKEIIEGIANTIRLTNPKGIRMSEMGGHAIIGALKEKHAEVFKNLSMLLFIKAQDKVFWVSDPEENNPTIRCQDDVDAEVGPDERPIEEIIEERRRALPPGGTPVTEESFKAWKERREMMRLAQVEEAAKAAKAKGQKATSAMSGRDLFTFDASLFVDEDGAISENEYECAEDPAFSDDDEEPRKAPKDEPDMDEDEDEDEADKEAIPEPAPGAASSSGAQAASGGEVPINKDLFLQGGDVDDLDDLDDLDD
eukprot:TRINITY_DN113151_c0_g1_i1.p1 TRINITY_DN113151_c0_g1~~TRINITY_DN113151_c0_g1_i1.p1  ORF type:complete len:367 (-),score=142.62 TRINITY_DN113151_c0_g1_i1:83-1183(-)